MIVWVKVTKYMFSTIILPIMKKTSIPQIKKRGVLIYFVPNV